METRDRPDRGIRDAEEAEQIGGNPGEYPGLPHKSLPDRGANQAPGERIRARQVLASKRPRASRRRLG